MFTFHRTSTDRNITFSTKEHPNTIQSVDSVEARTCYIFKITNISASQYKVSYLLEIVYIQRDKQIDTDRQTGRWTERQTGKQTCRQTGKQADRQAEMQTATETDK